MYPPLGKLRTPIAILTGFGPAALGEILTEERLVVQPSGFCSAVYDVKPFDRYSGIIGISLPKLFNDDSVMCAKREGSNAGTCAGDSGGPLLKGIPR